MKEEVEEIYSIKLEENLSLKDIIYQRKNSKFNKNLELGEPISHLKSPNNSFFSLNWFLCSTNNVSFNSKDDFSLDSNEINYFWKLKSENRKLKESDKKIFNKLFHKVFNIYLNNEDILNEKWMEMGFQNSDPRTDFRGGGFLALKSICYFVDIEGKNTIENFKEYEFVFGILSINLSFFLIKFFHLFHDKFTEKFKGNTLEICSRKALKNFCYLGWEKDFFFGELHNLLINCLFIEWQKVWKKNKENKFEIFNKLLNKVQKNLSKSLEFKIYKNFDEFVINFVDNL